MQDAIAIVIKLVRQQKVLARAKQRQHRQRADAFVRLSRSHCPARPAAAHHSLGRWLLVVVAHLLTDNSIPIDIESVVRQHREAAVLDKLRPGIELRVSNIAIPAHMRDWVHDPPLGRLLRRVGWRSPLGTWRVSRRRLLCMRPRLGCFRGHPCRACLGSGASAPRGQALGVPGVLRCRKAGRRWLLQANRAHAHGKGRKDGRCGIKQPRAHAHSTPRHAHKLQIVASLTRLGERG